MIAVCGIAFTSFVSRSLASVMSRRGPDAYAFKTVPAGTLHHAQLRINGDQQQPIVIRSVATVYNGEVYNAAELGGRPDQDAALMAEGFQEQGIPFLRRVNGTWSFIQTTQRTVTAVRDRFGLRPLFRYFDGEYLVYASNIATIAAALAQLGRTLTTNSAYPTRGRIPLPSYYRHVVPLPPGTIEIASLRGTRWSIRQNRWYSPSPFNHGTLREILEAAVRRRLHPAAAIAVSGGVDSYLLHVFAEATIPMFHLNVTGEAAAAQRIGAFLLIPKEASRDDVAATLEQPFYANPPNYWLAQAIRDVAPHVRVVLTGVGADELFGGYKHHVKPFTTKRYQHVYGIDPPEDTEEWRTAELEHAIAHHYGYRTDQMFLRFGLEARHPYLDHEVVETALCYPHDGKTKLKSLAEDLGWHVAHKRGFSADLSSYLSK